MASLLDLAQARLGGLLAPQRPSMAGLLGGQRTQGNLASALQGYTPPQMTALTNPQVMDYARNVAQSAQQNLQTQMSDLDKAIVMGQQGVQVGDREALARLMEQVPGLMGATAYHGTPYNIRGKFDISKVGTGEGAQAYGHGMYFAENPSVAGEYAKNLSNRDITNQGRLNAHANAQRLAAVAGDPKYAADDIKFVLESNPNHEQKKLLTETLGYLESGAYKNPLETTGNLYKVDIPDEYIPMMLDWDKPLKDQSKTVQDALAKLDPDMYSPKGMDYDPTERGQWIYMRLAGDTTQKNASNKLNEFGVKGIRYNDAGSRTAEGGTSNYVVFDPTDVKILEKNSQKVEGLLD